MAMLSEEACGTLAEMLNMVEEKNKWPQVMQQARAALLAKDPDDPLNPLAQRILLMLPTTYRLWTKIRLKHLTPWMEAWALPQMYAGVPGKSAADAAYKTATTIEWCRLAQQQYVGGSADIYKCFDQIVRPLVDRMLQAAGMPAKIRRTYVQYIDNLQVRNTVAGGLGKAYSRPTGIPQGDPFSMMVTSLLLRPWIAQMASIGAIPRVLADDLQVMAYGDDSLQKYVTAADLTHKHLQDMGAKVSAGKCINFASSETTRVWLRTHKWRRLNKTISVQNECRDLGARLNMAGKRRTGRTLTERLHKAAKYAGRVGIKKAPNLTKVGTGRAKVIPMGTYGCETAPVNESAIRQPRASIADAITYTTVRRSPDLVFATNSMGTDIDPDIAIHTQRVVAMRRAIVKDKDMEAVIKDIMRMYALKGGPGIYSGDENLAAKQLAGEPGSRTRAQVRAQCDPQGPIGHVLESMHMHAAAVNSRMEIVQHNQPTIGIISAPAQHVAPLVRNMCTRNRTRAAEGSRQETVGLAEIDDFATKGDTHKMDDESRFKLDITRTGSAWNRSAAFWSGQAPDKICQLCNAAEEDALHHWTCEATKKEREQADEELASIDPCHIPDCVKIGIAPAMSACVKGTFWGGVMPDDVPIEHKKLCGMDSSREVPETIARHTDQLHGFTAREVMQYLAEQGHRDNARWEDEQVSEEPPAEPNVYTDGSLTNPDSWCWQVGGLGVWWPDRQLQQEPLTQKESTYADVEQKCHGVSMANIFTDLRGSSTRCEVAAAILALLPRGAVHIATDSQSLVQRGKAIIQWARQKAANSGFNGDGRMQRGGTNSRLRTKNVVAKDWRLVKDADLRSIFEALVQGRGPNSVDISKVKGHSTAEMVESGTVRAEDKHGNDAADTAADRGVMAMQTPLFKTGKTFAKKHGEYRDCMARVHKYLVAIRDIVTEKRAAAKSQEDPFASLDRTSKKVHVQQKLQYAEAFDTQPVQLVRPILSKYGRTEAVEIASIAAFMTNTKWKKAAEGKGITWMELFLWYSMHTPTRERKDEFRAFKKAFRKVVTDCVRVEEEDLFYTQKTSYPRLKPLAIDNMHPSIRGLPHMDDSDAEMIAKTIIAMRGVASTKSFKSMKQGNLKLVSKALKSSRCKDQWRQAIGTAEDWTTRPRYMSACENQGMQLCRWPMSDVRSAGL